MIDFKLPSYVEGMTGDKSLSKAVNRALLLELVKKTELISRAELAKKSGLTKATVSSQISALIELGIVRETGVGESEMGRKPVMLEIKPDAGYVLGISIVSDLLHVVSMDMRGMIVKDDKIPLEESSPASVIENIKHSVTNARRRYGKSRYGLTGVGIAVPGAMERDTGRIIRSAKLDWTDVSLVEELSSGFDGFIHTGNDATLATIAERELYAPGEDDFVCLLIDEGIGLGAYINGAVQYGHNGQFGEVGHMTVAHGGPRCPCGNYGCWDLYGSELALRQELSRPSGGRLISEEDMVRTASIYPAENREIFDGWVDYLTTGVVNVINSMAPSIIDIDSSVLSASPELFDRLRRQVTDRSMAHLPTCELRSSTLGKSAAAVGAGMAVQSDFFRSLVLMDR